MNERLSRQERKAQTRERLIDAAAQVFAQRGFEAASLDEVAAAAGYTKGAVYSNFASKTDLLIALLERRIEVQSAEYAHRFEGQDAEEIARDLLSRPITCRTRRSSFSCFSSSSGSMRCATSGRES